MPSRAAGRPHAPRQRPIRQHDRVASAGTLTGCTVLVLLVMASLGCKSAIKDGDAASIEEPPPKPRVIVREFDTTGVMVENMAEPIAPLGRRVSEAIVENLGWWEYDASMARDAAPGPGKLLVEGRITSVDGGSRAARWAAAGMAGAVSFSVQGRVIGEDGLIVADFDSTQTGSWGAFGGSYEGLLASCISGIGAEVAEMIVEGEYPHSPEVGKPWDSASYAPSHDNVSEGPSDQRPPKTTEARLQELERLYEKGLITQQERKAQRQKILSDL